MGCNCNKPKPKPRPRPRPSSGRAATGKWQLVDGGSVQTFGSKLEAEAERVRRGRRGVVRQAR